jgi:hypothetical protein
MVKEGYFGRLVKEASALCHTNSASRFSHLASIGLRNLSCPRT